MASVIDYPLVLARAEALGLRCVYYNAGAFGYPNGEPVHVVGWLGPDDPTVRPGLAAATVRMPAPYPANLARKFAGVWRGVIDGDAWLMPKSHWSFELDHGNGDWLAPALRQAGVDPDALRPRTNGAAVAFTPGDPRLAVLVECLLTNLRASDFAVLFPRHRHLLTIHHHQQLWWQTPDAAFVKWLAAGDDDGGPAQSRPPAEKLPNVGAGPASMIE